MLLFAALCLSIAPSLSAQDTAAPPPPADKDEFKLSADVDRVVLPVTVVDGKGENVSGLGKQNFIVYEDGKPREIRYFSSQDIPVTVGLVIDSSSSMGPKRNDTILAALHFIHLSNPDDEVFVVNFNEKVSLGLTDDTPFTSDPVKLRDALIQTKPAGKTALYDAVAKGIEELARGNRDKKALIVVSDGGDNASAHTAEQVLDMARKSNAIIYTIGLFDEADQDKNPGVLRKLAHSTGGELFLPDKPSEIQPICAHIARDLRNQYTIGFEPSDGAQNGAYHRVRVVASAPGKGKLVARTRPGFYSPNHTTAAAGGPR